MAKTKKLKIVNVEQLEDGRIKTTYSNATTFTVNPDPKPPSPPKP